MDEIDLTGIGGFENPSMEVNNYFPDITSFQNPSPEPLNLTGLELGTDYMPSQEDIRQSSYAANSSLSGYINAIGNLIPSITKSVGSFISPSSGKANNYFSSPVKNGVSSPSMLSALMPGVQSKNFPMILIIGIAAFVVFILMIKR